MKLFIANFSLKKLFFCFFLLLLFFTLSNNIALANDNPIGLEYSDQLGLENSDVVDPRIIAVNVVKFLLSFIGLIAVSMFMYAGFLWMTSQGDPSKVGRAKTTLINAAIGLVVIVSAFAIVLYIQSIIEDEVVNFQPGPDSGRGLSGGLGASGNQVIESHYPDRGQTNIPRNTKIVVSFREEMDPSTIMNGTDLNTDNVLVSQRTDIGTGPYLNNFIVSATPDNRTFVLTQNGDYLGSPSENIWYSVRLQSGITTLNGRPAFGTGQHYEWSFEVGTEIDTTPPTVTDVVPRPDSEEPRNVVVQINFSEGVDPVLSSGPHNPPDQTFSNLVVTDLTSSSQLVGYFYISNFYETVEFLTNTACGTNSCGDTVYCLPGNSDISVRVNAASLTTFLGGVTDLAGNSLDGNADGVAQGPEAESGLPPYNENAPNQTVQGDDLIWTFSTNDTVDLTAPQIIRVTPDINAVNVNLSARPTIRFNKYLMSSTIHKSSVVLYANPVVAEVFYSPRVVNDGELSQSEIQVYHDEFAESSQYIPECNSGIKDIYQNCYFPANGGGGGPSCTPDPDGGNPYCCNGALSPIPCSGIAPAVCDDGICENGECATGCSADCSFDLCCGREGCNPGIGEDEDTCATDCNSGPPPPPPPPPPPSL